MTVKECILNNEIEPGTRVSIFGDGYYCYFMMPVTRSIEFKELYLINLLGKNVNKEINNFNHQIVENINEKYFGIFLK